MVITSILVIVASLFSVRYMKSCGGGYNGYTKENTNAIKGILSLFILLSHLTSKVEYEIPLFGLSCMGAVGVGCFFFLSGYALAVSEDTKPGYAGSFFGKRLSRILIPYAFLLAVYFIIGWYVGFSTPGYFFRSFRNGAPVSNSWYVFGQIYCYILFWLAYGIVKKHKFLIIIAGTVIYIYLTAFLLDWGDWWYKSVISFPIGLAWGFNRKKVLNWLNQKYFLKLAIGFAFFGFAYLFPAINSRVGLISDKQIWLWNDVLMSLSGTLLLGVFLARFSVKNPITEFLGKVSFETYLWHGFVMDVLMSVWASYKQSRFGQELFALLVVTLTLLIAYGMNTISKKARKLN